MQRLSHFVGASSSSRNEVLCCLLLGHKSLAEEERDEFSVRPNVDLILIDVSVFGNLDYQKQVETLETNLTNSNYGVVIINFNNIFYSQDYIMYTFGLIKIEKLSICNRNQAISSNPLNSMKIYNYSTTCNKINAYNNYHGIQI